MLKLYVWFQKLDELCSGFIKTEKVNMYFRTMKIVERFCLVLITYLDILDISEYYKTI